MTDEQKSDKGQNSDNEKRTRIHGTDAKAKRTTYTRKVATGIGPKGKKQEFASAGRYTSISADGETISDDVVYRNQIRSLGGLADALLSSTDSHSKTAGLFSDGDLGSFANVADSANIGYYSYEFPVDALELPASRAEELRFYRLAYDRDPIVGRAIDMHTELPLSKMETAKPKCSSEEFADFVFDEYQRFIQKTNLFQVLIQACREYWTVGEAFIFVEKKNEVKPCKEALKILEKNQKGDASEPGKESEFHSPLGGTSDRILEYLEPQRTASWVRKQSALIDELTKYGISFDVWEDSGKVANEVQSKKAQLNQRTRQVAKLANIPAKDLAKLIIAADSNVEKKAKEARLKLAKVIGRINPDDELNAPIQITADMAKTADPAPAPAPAAGGGTPPGADPGGEGAPLGEAGLEDVAGVSPSGVDPVNADPSVDAGTVSSMGDPGMGTPPMGMGGGGGMSIPQDMAGEAQQAIAMGASVSAQRELMEMKHYLRLLERKKELLEELKEIRDKKKEELELFSHVTNKEYDGPDKIQILPPEQIEIVNDGIMGEEPTIYYKPPEEQKQAYLNDPEVPNNIKDIIQTEGKIPLSADPLKGSYVIHFARKKSNYELHGRSVLQRCIRTVIYREKLRQVQSTLASRNMTPKTLVIAPGIPATEVLALRAHIDEAKADPDYSVVLNYEARWDEIGSEGRLLALDGEWQHTNSDLAIGLGLSPEILIGEGMYSGNHIQLQLMETSYLQFRDLLTGILEDQIFKPIAMEKGLYEMDKYGRPRWIFPKVTFSRMALRDQGDMLDMLFNLHSRGAVPIEIIWEFLNLDSEDCKRKLEDALFTVNDSKFNEMVSNIYGSVGEWMMSNTDLGKRLTKGLTLETVDHELDDDKELEGSGQGV